MPNALKTIAQWITYGMLLIAAGAAVLANKADTALIERVRVQVIGAVAPILELMASPAAGVSGAVDSVRDWLRLADDNARLRSEVARLAEWRAVAERLEAENADLRALLNYVPEPEARFVAARVIADSGGAFAQSLLLNAGSQHGIAKGHVVMTGEGLVGRVIGVAPRASRALLITDLNSRVPVTVGVHGVRAILAGDNTDLPKLVHVEPGATIVRGDRVVTSALTGAFPPGLPVGMVAETERLDASVRPLFDRSRLDFVRVVDLGLAPALAGAMKPSVANSGGGTSTPPSPSPSASGARLVGSE
ncbi:MAG: rod shape-determining protein MreC [Rhodospirillales bacterium]|jgi:rod shape-determining protein MreC|nr:rod shape-determining protein MreC [Rhodospirillales bacterium]